MTPDNAQSTSTTGSSSLTDDEKVDLLQDRLAAWTLEDIANEAGVALHDIAIRDVQAVGMTDAYDFGRHVRSELLNEEGKLKPNWRKAAKKILNESLVRADADAVIVVLVRLGTVIWYLRR